MVYMNIMASLTGYIVQLWHTLIPGIFTHSPCGYCPPLSSIWWLNLHYAAQAPKHTCHTGLWLSWAVHGRYWYKSFIDDSTIWGVDRTDPWVSEMEHPLVVPPYDMSCAFLLLTVFYGLDFVTDIDINPSSMGPILKVWVGSTLGVRNVPPAIGPQLFGSSAVVRYVTYLDFLNWILCVRFHVRYWYQSFINGFNIWGVYRTYPWGPQIYHPPLDRGYLVVVPSYDNWVPWFH